MSGDDFLGVLSFARRHPNSTTRLEKRFSMFCAMFANANRGKDSPTAQPHEFCSDLLSRAEQDAIEKKDKELSERRDKAWRAQRMGYASVANNKSGGSG